MCSFLGIISESFIDINRLQKSNNSIKSRGPNSTNMQIWEEEGVNFATIHNLLDISGSSITQPLNRDRNKFLLFNGEIYKPSDGIKPDTINLFDNYLEDNIKSFLSNSSSEFVIVTIDIISKELNIYRDPIGTKPIFFSIENNSIGFASYKSALADYGFTKIIEAQPNKITSIKFTDIKKPTINIRTFYDFDLNQNQNSLVNWKNLFLQSIKNRVRHFESKVFVPLSAGYDSGAICCALNKLNIEYVTVTLGDHENTNILKKRIKINKKFSCIKHYQLKPVSNEVFNITSNNIREKLGEIHYEHIDGDRESPISLHEDGGAIGLYKICEYMSKLGFNTLISGSGADEIYSDYGFNGKKFFTHSEFGGLFPENLSEIFPWKKFYGDTQRSYLKKDEMISGLFGIEGRYPYLDKDLIQAFISLKTTIKNQRYKNCLASFLVENNYPFEEEVKDGFYPKKSKYTIYERIYNKFKNIFIN